jgi:DNA-binding HxlR family transcriptional regulator
MRSYGEYCSIARSLDVIGDRWTLLIVRELVNRGACRYTDLRHGLPGIATNLLADRLRELEAAGVIAREEAPPPIATTLFRLTPRGEQLGPVLDHLSVWGIPLMREQRDDDAVRSHWLASMLQRVASDVEPDGPSLSLEVRAGDEPIGLRFGNGGLQVGVGAVDSPDARVEGPAAPIMGLLIGMLPVAQAKAAGVKLSGNRAVLRRLRADGNPYALSS